MSSDGGSGKPGREDNIGSIITMLITDQVSTYLHIYIYRECLHKQSVRASALQIANQSCQLKVRALLSLEKMSIFNPISGIFLLVSKVQCTVEKCTVRMKVKITLYSTAAASGGGCSAGAAHQSRAQSTSVLRPAHLSQGCHEYSNYSNNRL